MDAVTRSRAQMMIPVLVIIAIAGYLLGIKHDQSPSAAAQERTRTAYGASVQIKYPIGWGPTSEIPSVPGLPVASPLVLAPNGNAAHAGLLSGELPHGSVSPLPDSFLKILEKLPHTEVVELVNVQAYRYSEVHVQGYTNQLELYVVPNSGANPTALACYAAKGYTRFLHQCQDMVAKLTLTGVSSFNLNPEPGYAGRLGKLVETLDRERLSLRQRMSSATTATVSRLATELADRLSTLSSELVQLEPPIAAQPAQSALLEAIGKARTGYHRLAAVAHHQRSADYNAARDQVTAAEKEIDGALENFALLGYAGS